MKQQLMTKQPLIELSESEKIQRNRSELINFILSKVGENNDETNFRKEVSLIINNIENHIYSDLPYFEPVLFIDKDNLISSSYTLKQHQGGAFFTELQFVDLYLSDYSTIDIEDHLEYENGYILDTSSGTGNLFVGNKLFEKYQHKIIANDICQDSLNIFKLLMPGIATYKYDIIKEIYNKKTTGKSYFIDEVLNNKKLIVYTNTIWRGGLVVNKNFKKNPMNKDFKAEKDYWDTYLPNNQSNIYSELGPNSRGQTECFILAGILELIKPKACIFIAPTTTMYTNKEAYTNLRTFVSKQNYGMSDKIMTINNRDFQNVNIDREVAFFEYIQGKDTINPTFHYHGEVLDKQQKSIILF